MRQRCSYLFFLTTYFLDTSLDSARNIELHILSEWESWGQMILYRLTQSSRCLRLIRFVA